MKTLLRHPPGLCLIITAAAILFAREAICEPWTAPLERGGQVEVDPRTNRPVIIQDGRQIQLWDGVHKLDDGSVIRIQGGQVVPTTDMLDQPGAPQTPLEPNASPDDAQVPDETSHAGINPLTGASLCEQLVLRVCGATRSCWSTPACDAARQLRDLEQEDRISGGDPNRPTPTSQHCSEALTNPFFARCD